ncbi:MAG: ACT domain-containing protein [Clostridiales bacterium]|jgi:hypothetical protein|nr:ACT domain-containing protein [Clostridiales bacterium]
MSGRNIGDGGGDGFTLVELAASFSVCKLAPGAEITQAMAFAARSRGTFFLARTSDEISLVCETSEAPDGAQRLAAEHGWRGLKVAGTLDFGLVGIIARLTGVLAERAIPVFVASTYDTDYIFVKATNFPAAIHALRDAGCTIN